MRFDDGESRYSRYARRSQTQQKRLIIYIVVLVGVLVAMFALKRGRSSIDWAPSFEAAKARASAEDKPILAFFYMGDSEDCQRMARDTFGDPAVRARAAGFVCVRLDAEAHPETAKRCLVNVLDYPAVAFLSPAGERLLVFWGDRDPRHMLREMDTAMEEWQLSRIVESPSLPPRSAEPSRGDADSSEPTSQAESPGSPAPDGD
ncbi:MAG: thioredoxin family protein [Verrucomicrobia bacterium]|nr:thioredoxin family protein [Verrucomicrobiota bacterium]